MIISPHLHDTGASYVPATTAFLGISIPWDLRGDPRCNDRLLFALHDKTGRISPQTRPSVPLYSYGDITLGEGARIFGTFAGVSGVLTIGISTAFLVALMGKLVPKPLSDLK